MLESVVRTALFATAAVASVGAPATAPTPSAIATPGATLKEIGRVRVTSPLCKALVGNAVRAIGIETENDRRLGDVTNVLRTIDLDSNQIVKHRGTQEITRRFVDLRAAAVEGNAVMKQFRDEAKTAPTEERRAALKSFADALDGALHRQKVLADDIGRLVAYLDSHEPIDKETHDAMIFNALLRGNDSRYPHSAFDVRAFGPTAGVPDTLSTTAKYASAELVSRAQPIPGDESEAAARIEPAFDGC